MDRRLAETERLPGMGEGGAFAAGGPLVPPTRRARLGVVLAQRALVAAWMAATLSVKSSDSVAESVVEARPRVPSAAGAGARPSAGSLNAAASVADVKSRRLTPSSSLCSLCSEDTPTLGSASVLRRCHPSR